MIDRMKLSVVVPVFNEGASVRNAWERITQVLSSRLPELDYEIIFVDDGSADDSFAHLSQLTVTDSHTRALRLLTNCGAHMAIRAGLEHATGDIACFLACDMQEPPELIPELLRALAGSVQIVWAVRNTRRDPWSTQVVSRSFYLLARLLVTKNIPPSGSSMFLLGGDALAAIQQHRERNLTLEGLCATLRLPQAYVPYDRESRQDGVSKWTLEKKLKLFADFFVGYSYVPIRAMSYVGILVATLGFLYAAVVLLLRLVFATTIPGWASLMLVMLIMGGIQMVMLGVIGEYVWRGLDESRQRPRYIIAASLNDPKEISTSRAPVSAETTE